MPAASIKDREIEIAWTVALIVEKTDTLAEGPGVAEWTGVGGRRNFRKLEILITVATEGPNWSLNCVKLIASPESKTRWGKKPCAGSQLLLISQAQEQRKWSPSPFPGPAQRPPWAPSGHQGECSLYSILCQTFLQGKKKKFWLIV